MINLTIGISSCLNFEIPLAVLISTGISFLILRSYDDQSCGKFNSGIPSFLFFGIPDEPPCYVWQCYRCVNLKGCLGVRCHKCKCIGAPQYAMLIFGFSFLWVLARIRKETMQLYLLAITPLLQLFISNITIP